MPRYAAFLRGMNVGGHRLTNEELRAHFTAMGFGEVASFRASGNVIFAAGDSRPRQLGPRIEAGLQTALGYAVPTYIRSAREVRAIAAMQPFAPEHVRASTGKLHVALLAEPPAAAARERVLEMASARDRLLFGERGAVLAAERADVGLGSRSEARRAVARCDDAAHEEYDRADLRQASRRVSAAPTRRPRPRRSPLGAALPWRWG
jgi:uncharacterized protein (DUF1697 family)